MGIGLILLTLLAIAMIAAPIVVPIVTQIELGFASNTVMTIAGVALLAMVGIILIVTKLYVKARADEAFVRTGLGGAKIIQDGGALVIGIFHDILKISLQTMKLEVVRENKSALITSDALRVDIGSEFYIKVKPDDEGIMQAARSLGPKMQSGGPGSRVKDAAKELLEEKLVNVLREVASKRTLFELHRDRETFVSDISKSLVNDLRENGMILETVTISRLDQTDVSNLDDNNVFDAQGRATIAQITEGKKTERNQMEREGERLRKQEDVETRQRVLTLEQDEKNAEAVQQAEVAKVRAEQEKEAREKAISAQRSVEIAEVQKMRDLEIEGIRKSEASEKAQEARQLAVAEAAKQKAAKEAELAKAQSLREKEQQQVKMVEVEETAKREKQKAVISAQAKAEQLFVTEQRGADAEAYKKEKDAEARKKAADADAEAITKKAQAEANAEKAKAEGQKAVAMVPVDVDREKVKIDQDRVENVIKPELEARQESGKVAQDFEIAKLEVDAHKQVRIASAQAMATIGENITCKLYGAPEDAGKMMRNLVSGQGVMSAVEGFVGAGGGDMVKSALSAAEGLLKDDEETPEQLPQRPANGGTQKPKPAQ
jgi:flotillin